MGEIVTDEKRRQAAEKLHEAALEYWKVCHSEGQHGAVQWVTYKDDALIIYTRGEYRDQLMANISTIPYLDKMHVFGERVDPLEDDE